MDAAPTFTGWISDLARHHTRTLASVARREGLSSDDALDAVQEAFHTLLLLPQARTLVEDGDDSRAHDALDAGSELAGDLPGVDELLARAEDHVTMVGCVTRLGDVQRRVVTLRMRDELSSDEVAAELGLTTGHVAVLLHRAKKALVGCIE